MFGFIINGNSSGGGGGGSAYTYTISSDASGVNLWNAVVADNNGSVPSETNIEVIIDSGVTIGAVDNTQGTNYAINVDLNFAINGKNLTITNNGYIGGFGGKGGMWDSAAPGNGQNGGCGINFASSATLINNGTIAGGGGGGGANVGETIEPQSSYVFYADGGGGAGVPAGSAGGGYSIDPNHFGANDGTKTAGGLANQGVDTADGRAGNGGNPGIDGQSIFGAGQGGSGGPPYQVLSGTVTVTNNGSILGTPTTS